MPWEGFVKPIFKMNTKVKCRCVSKKQTVNWDKAKPIAHAIELQVPYDQNSIYYQLSGGTALVLNTINQEAANMFELGKDYDLTIAPSVPE